MSFNKGFTNVKIELSKNDINEIVFSYLSRITDCPKENVSILWGKEEKAFLSDIHDFSCIIKTKKSEKSHSTSKDYFMEVVFKENSDDMKEAFIQMIIEYYDLEDHEYTHKLIKSSIRLERDLDDEIFVFEIKFSFNNK